jgi:23S rRNA (adenine2030-N6)-methyltransferase
VLSYRHSFHAGNFADVLKHLILDQILKYLVIKDKPVIYIDTHAGTGGYSLGSSQARKNREHEGGIGRLWAREDLPDAIAEYVRLVQAFNKTGDLRFYPGSPWFARRLLRPQDRLELFELHHDDFKQLKKNIAGKHRIKLHATDGFKGAIGLLPALERRGLVLMDPSYEVKSDYREVVTTLASAHRRFQTGTFAIWYPVVERYRIDGMERAVKATGIRNVQCFELGIRPVDQPGMSASGMLLVNPPWTLFATLEATLPYLAEVLGEQGGGYYRAEVLVSE